jgi:rhodanese-related sulfurtransferase
MGVRHVSVEEAHALQQQGSTYVDVRSTDEFLQGHPSGAVNVPLFEVDEDAGCLSPNPDFVRVMRANFPPDTRLLIGCQMGGRSMRAAQMLVTFGFADVAAVTGGFAGARDPSGRLIEAGWAESGLPVSEIPARGAAYADLLANADRVSP